jgi:hypothetical protein
MTEVGFVPEAARPHRSREQAASDETCACAKKRVGDSRKDGTYSAGMTSPTHPLARLKEAAAQWVLTAPTVAVHDKFTLSMRATVLDDGTVAVGGVVLRPEYTVEDLRYEIGEWDGSRLVEVLGRVSSMDGAKALLEAEHARAPGKVLVLRHGARVIDKRGTEPDGGR